MEKFILSLNKLYETYLKSKNQKWEEFRVFHEEIIEILHPELGELLPSIPICRRNPTFKLRFTPSDYAWWGMIDKSKCDIIPLFQIKRKFVTKLSELVNEDSDNYLKLPIENLKEAKDLLKSLNLENLK